MSETANRLALMLAALGKRERAALRVPEPAKAVARLARIARVRCAVLLGIALNNREKLGLTEETITYVITPDGDAQ